MKFAEEYDRISSGEFETFLTVAVLPVRLTKTKLKEKSKGMRKKNKRTALFITRGAIVAAMYVALTYLASMLGLSSGVIQFRISEALCILPIFMPEAIPGLAIGCLLSNALTGCVPWDIALGTVATLIGAVGAYMLRKLPKKLIWIATLPTVLANAIIVPFVLLYAYGSEGGYFYFMLTVGIGEVVCASIGGTLLYFAMKKARFK